MIMKIIRTVNNVRNPKWNNAEHTQLNCEVDFNELDEVYVKFTADPNDTEEHGKKIYADCVAEKYGTVAEFDSVAFEAQREADRVAKEEADAKYQASLDKWKALGLTEDDLKNLGIS